MKTICYIDASNLIRTGYKVDHILRFLKNNNKDVEVYSFWKSTAKEIRVFLGGKWNNLDVKHYKDKIELIK